MEKGGDSALAGRQFVRAVADERTRLDVEN